MARSFKLLSYSLDPKNYYSSMKCFSQDVELQTNRDKKTRYCSFFENWRIVFTFSPPWQLDTSCERSFALCAKIDKVVSLTRYKLQFQKESKKELAESRERAHNPIEVSFQLHSLPLAYLWGVFSLFLDESSS